MSTKKFFESSYKNRQGIPWAKTSFRSDLSAGVPKKLIEAIEIGLIDPCKTLDLGCGEGYTAIYLAKNGFSVTGVDYSKKAIAYAKKNAKEFGVKVKFLVKNVYRIETLKQKFDLIVELGFLHHCPKNKWEPHFKKIHNLMNSNGLYVIACFNVNSLKASGEKKLIGEKLYLSSPEELKKILSKRFIILQGEVIDLSHKWPGRIINYLLVKKR